MVNKVTNYQVGDFLIKIKNAAMAKNKTVRVVSNKKILALAEALKKMGFLDEVKKDKEDLVLSLTFKNKAPRLMNVKLISKPGLRVYKTVADIEEQKSPSVYMISTPKGVISGQEAIKLRVGGEVIAEIL
jgi:small subunit ribosomal protein S8